MMDITKQVKPCRPFKEACLLHPTLICYAVKLVSGMLDKQRSLHKALTNNLPENGLPTTVPLHSMLLKAPRKRSNLAVQF